MKRFETGEQLKHTQFLTNVNVFKQWARNCSQNVKERKREQISASTPGHSVLQTLPDPKPSEINETLYKGCQSHTVCVQH